jgi:adenylate kinase
MKIILFGPPGSGKSVLANFIKNEFNLSEISLGNLIRLEINNKTLLGNKIKEFFNTGTLIPNNIVYEIIYNNISKNKNMLIDGFPRNIEQAKFLSYKNISIDYIINLSIEEKFLFKRLKYRLISSNSTNYNILYKSPKIKNKDDKTGEYLIIRKDDNIKIIKKRIKIYNENNLSIIEWYKNKSNLINMTSDNNISKMLYIIKKKIKFYEKNL